MSVVQVVFIVLSAVTLGGGLAMVTSRNLLHSALLMILTFVGVAGLYVLLEAPFLAAIQILVYVGAIATLIIFAVMLTRRMMFGDSPSVNEQWGWVVVVAVLLFAVLTFVVTRVDWRTVAAAPPADTIAELGRVFMGTYVLPFEVASVLLLVALIGSIVIAREK